MFAIVTSDGTVAVTDYTGYLGTEDLVPDVVTMNNAHSTHYTDTPEEGITYVLRGWPSENGETEARLAAVGAEPLVEAAADTALESMEHPR